MNKFVLVIELIFLICFNVVFVLFNGTDNSTSTWITYAFINIALLFPFLVGTLKFRKTDMSASAILISGIYCFAELIVGIILLIINPDSWIWPFVLQLIILSIAAVLVLSYLAIDKK